jgi:hypothetical protein
MYRRHTGTDTTVHHVAARSANEAISKARKIANRLDPELLGEEDDEIGMTKVAAVFMGHLDELFGMDGRR